MTKPNTHETALDTVTHIHDSADTLRRELQGVNADALKAHSATQLREQLYGARKAASALLASVDELLLQLSPRIDVVACVCCGALYPDHMLSDDDRCIDCAGEQPE